jgi:hypothetical protein
MDTGQDERLVIALCAAAGNSHRTAASATSSKPWPRSSPRPHRPAGVHESCPTLQLVDNFRLRTLGGLRAALRFARRASCGDPCGCPSPRSDEAAPALSSGEQTYPDVTAAVRKTFAAVAARRASRSE